MSQRAFPLELEALATLTQLRKVRGMTETICRPLSEEDALLSVTTETSPPKWHLAHTTWFFEKFILKEFLPDYREFHPRFDYLFNSYYLTVGEFLPKKNRVNLSRPALSEIYEYRAYVNANLDYLLQHLSSEVSERVLKLIILGMNHEQQHQELLLMDIKRNFFENPLSPAYQSRLESHARSSLTLEPMKQKSSDWLSFAGGLSSFGVGPELESSSTMNPFAYDNEGGKHLAWVNPFELAAQLVTNREYLEFMEEGGYETPSLWLSDGWDWVKQKEPKAPLYWNFVQGQWKLMTLSGLIELPLDHPVVHVNYFEAQAYAKWKHARLPTEYEWEFAANELAEHTIDSTKITGQFMEEGSFEPQATRSLHGSAWQWTQSAYLPYPGFTPLEASLGEYNEKFMCNQMVLRGGSCVTPHSHYRTTYRNFFYPHMQWQYSSIRLARSPAHANH